MTALSFKKVGVDLSSTMKVILSKNSVPENRADFSSGSVWVSCVCRGLYQEVLTTSVAERLLERAKKSSAVVEIFALTKGMFIDKVESTTWPSLGDYTMHCCEVLLLDMCDSVLMSGILKVGCQEAALPSFDFALFSEVEAT